MKVCLIASNSMDVSPYIKRYIMILEKMNAKYDIISKEPESHMKKTFDANNNVFFYKKASNKISKVKRFWDYAGFAKKIVCSGKYDRVVLFSGVNAVFAYMRFGGYLKKKCKYIVDIRDYDKIYSQPFFVRLLKSTIENAEKVIISSAKFKDWLPKSNNISVMHNIPNTGVIVEKTSAFSKEKITVGFFGGIGYYEQNRAIADSVKNSDKISLMYAGIYPSSYNIKDYCAENGMENVRFHGKYNDSEKSELYKSVDIINAVYGNDSLVVTTALPNKLYDCIYYKIPIMACSGTYLSEIVENYSLGFSVEPKEDNVQQKIIEYASGFDSSKFENGCSEYMNNVLCEQNKTENIIRNFFEV